MIELDNLQQVHDDIQESIKVLEGCEDKMHVLLNKDVLNIAKRKLITARGWLATLILWIREENNNLNARQ